MKGIRRYGSASVPMDETIANVSLDISGRPYLVYNVSYPKRSKIKSFDVSKVDIKDIKEKTPEQLKSDFNAWFEAQQQPENTEET